MESYLEGLETEVKSFVNKLPYWGKYLSDKILSGVTISDAETNTAYNYLLEELDLISKSEKPEIIFLTDSKSLNGYKADLKLSKVSNVEGVNALCENQTIEFSSNLTIIYGTNGCGKSGYTRLLKKAFYSKAPEEIHPNVYLATGHKSLSAQFFFSSESLTYSLEFPRQSAHSEFLQFSVFDGKSVLKQLEGKNSFEFRPSGLNFFGSYIDSVKKIETKLNADISCKQTQNLFTDLFDGASPVKTLIESLSANTDISILKKHLPFSEEDEKQMLLCQKEYNDMLFVSKSKEKEMSKLLNIKQLLSTNKQAIISLNQFFTKDAINQTIIAIKDCLDKENAARKEGVENFASEYIEETGSQEWKSFIEAAQRFALKQKEKYPIDGDRCIMCHQPLSVEAQTLISNYWLFIKSVAENEAKAAQLIINKAIQTYQNLTFELFSEESILSAWLLEFHPTLLEKFQLDLSKLGQLSKVIIEALASKSVNLTTKPLQVVTEEHDKLISSIDGRLKSLSENKEPEELSVLETQIRFLLHRQKLSVHFEKIEKYIGELKWLEKAKKVNWGKRNVTEAEKSLSSKYFNQKYVDAFNEECIRLKGNFGIAITHTGSGGTSFRQLFIKGKNPAVILSEGEQKVIAISDFIAEMKLSDTNRGIIFDDPVTSLDEERKSNIAERLADEARIKQVIVFTHDLVFVSCLVTACEEGKILFDCHWIEKLEDVPGTVWLKNAPTFEKSYKKSGKAQDYLNEAKKCGPQEREDKIKNGFAALRTSYETVVVFDLFKGVVQRFNERVSVDSLSSVAFDIETRDQLLDSFYQCCRYMEGHSHSDKYAYKKPTVENLNEEIIRFNEVKKKIAAASK